MKIRRATYEDWQQIWAFFEPIVRAGETYAFDNDIAKDTAKTLWLDEPMESYVVEENSTILGSYYLKTNHQGNAGHVCNCGYMTAPESQGKGVATIMCTHSQEVALARGFLAMQFNFVVSTNKRAIRLWKKLGFDIVGRLPQAFLHPSSGFVDALVMFKRL